MLTGGGKRDRTADLLHAMQAAANLVIYNQIFILCRLPHKQQ